MDIAVRDRVKLLNSSPLHSICSELQCPASQCFMWRLVEKLLSNLDEKERVGIWCLQKHNGNRSRSEIGNAAGRHINRTFQLERGTMMITIGN